VGGPIRDVLEGIRIPRVALVATEGCFLRRYRSKGARLRIVLKIVSWGRRFISGVAANGALL
jgi:hypothetical protein